MLGTAAGSSGLVRELLRWTGQVRLESDDDELATAGERAFDEVLARDLGRDPPVHRQPAREQLVPDVGRGAESASSNLHAERWEAAFVGNDHVSGPDGDEFRKRCGRRRGGRRLGRRSGGSVGLLRDGRGLDGGFEMRDRRLVAKQGRLEILVVAAVSASTRRHKRIVVVLVPRSCRSLLPTLVHRRRLELLRRGECRGRLRLGPNRRHVKAAAVPRRRGEHRAVP